MFNRGFNHRSLYKCQRHLILDSHRIAPVDAVPDSSDVSFKVSPDFSRFLRFLDKGTN